MLKSILFCDQKRYLLYNRHVYRVLADHDNSGEK